MSRLVITALVVAACVALTVAAYRMVPRESERLSPPVAEIWSEPAIAPRQISHAVTAHPVMVETEPIRTSGVPLEGVVTTVNLSDGGNLRHGDVAATVDLVPVLALATPTPFHRDLAAGDEGTDVLVLNGMLEELGYISPDVVDDRFGGGTAEGVRRFNEERLGLEDDRTFHAGRVLWLPEPATAVETVEIRLGGLWPPAGEPIAATPDVVDHLQIEFESGSEGDHVVTLTDTEYAAERTSPARWQVSGPFAAEDVELIDAADTEEGLDAQLIEAADRRVAAVPLGTVWVDEAGATCAVVARDGEQAAVQVAVTRSLPGELWLEPSAIEGAEVLLNPQESDRAVSRC